MKIEEQPMNKKDFSRNCLSQALIELLEDHEYEDISIQDIVDKAGFSRMAYYRNFKNKDEVIDYALDNIFNTFIKETNITFRFMGVEKFIETMFGWFSSSEMINLTKKLIKRGLIGHMYFQFVKRVQGGFIPNQNHYVYDYFGGGIFAVFISWVMGGLKESPEEMAKIGMDFLQVRKEKYQEQ